MLVITLRLRRSEQTLKKSLLEKKKQFNFVKTNNIPIETKQK